MMTPLLALLVALQQHPVENHAWSTPPSGDTVGYWQQRADYRIVATLDERPGVVRGVADLTYVNNSPDTLHEFFVHQHLNAFRPGSDWTRADAREGRVRFQNLRDPDFAYERFTTVPTFDGVPVAPRYPGAPDSTVAHFALPRPLPPGDSLRIHFEWDARPSTLPRRQGRRGRSFDLAQWYPRVAVYDRGGWQPNPLVPAGEFYGEFGRFDVTLVVPDDQVIGATGVPIEGDPGWQRALRWGSVHLKSDAYGDMPSAPTASVPPGFKRVRFLANDVHHFAWSTSPEYRYEGGAYVRGGPARARFPTWDTVAIHVLYQPGDTATWGKGLAVGRTILALRWLEQVFGPYAYPQMTNLHRIEGGGTEFPMMMMNGSASQGLILHEGGHIFAHGILGNNEWRSGWLDEGLTSYVSSWAASSTPQDRARPDSAPAAPGRSVGYRGRAVRLDPEFGAEMDQQLFVHTGRAEPLGTRADEFNEFAIYNLSVYSRAELMYGALREVLGDTAFRAFLRDYYHRWAFKHVDEQAMRGSAERVSGRELGWFFDQWVHRAGNLDYALADARVTRAEDGTWRTIAVIEKESDYRHPMPVGVRTRTGWTVTRASEPSTGVDTVQIVTGERPLEVRIDPYRTTYDWDRRNDVLSSGFATAGRKQLVFDWPFLDQAAVDRQLVAWRPWLMYGDAGGYAVGARIRSNYQGWIDRAEAGFATSIGIPDDRGRAADPGAWRNLWFSLENPTLGRSRVLNGVKLAGWHVDDVVRVDVSKTWDLAPFLISPPASGTIAVRAVVPNGLTYLDAAQWDDQATYEIALSAEGSEERWGGTYDYSAAGFLGRATGAGAQGCYERSEVDARWRRLGASRRWAIAARGFAAFMSDDAPQQRLLRLSADDPLTTFGNHFLRPRGAPLAKPGNRYTPLGGGGLRGYDPRVAASNLYTVNLEGGRQIVATDSTPGALALWLNLFADGGHAQLSSRETAWLADAGVGLAVRGMVFDRAVAVRFDVPLYLSREELGIHADADDEPFQFRWTFSFADLW